VELQDLTVPVGVLRRLEGRARQRPVLRQQPPLPITHAARVAQRAAAHRPLPPLRRRRRAAVQATLG
jgi:hypothetical protein